MNKQGQSKLPSVSPIFSLTPIIVFTLQSMLI